MKTGSATYSASIENAEKYMAWVVDQFKQYLHGKVLEVGLGHGSYRRFIDHVEYTGVDIDSVSIQRARDANPDGTYIEADISDAQFPLQNSNNFDAVLCINVLEHVKEDKMALEHLLQVLKPGGTLLLMVPAHPRLYSTMDQLAGHYRRYNRHTLLAVLPGQFLVEKCYYINPIGAIGWFVNKWFSHDDLNSRAINRQIIFFDRYIVPLSKLVTPLTRRIFGQSLICIVTR